MAALSLVAVYLVLAVAVGVVRGQAPASGSHGAIVAGAPYH